MRHLLRLDENTIDLWLCKPENITEQALLARYTDCLSDAEILKQQRYKFATDRHDALVTRAFVRDLLSHYHHCEPSDWQFAAKEKGKPEIISPAPAIKFNLSHTKGLIICAVTTGNEIGCDVENLNRNNAILDIADRYFSHHEIRTLNAMSSTEEKTDHFYNFWTLKESFIKAVGLGLAIPLGDFSFTIHDKTTNKFTDNIALTLTKSLNDDPKYWRSWLFYPSNQHRIAISLRAKHDNQDTAYNLRFFQSTPLYDYHPIDLRK